MKKIRLDTRPRNEIDLHKVDLQKPIVAVLSDGTIQGLIVQEERGWIVRTGGSKGAYGHSSTIEQCIQHGLSMGWIFVCGAKIDIRMVSR